MYTKLTSILYTSISTTTTKIQSYLIRNKNKFLHTLQGSPYNMTTLWTHRQNHTQNKWKIYVWVCPALLQFQFTHIWHRKQQFGYIDFQPILSPVSESSTHSLQNQMCLFLLTSRPGSYVHKSTHCHYLWTGTRLPSHKYNNRKGLQGQTVIILHVFIPENFVMTPMHLPRCLLAFPACSQTFKHTE